MQHAQLPARKSLRKRFPSPANALWSDTWCTHWSAFSQFCLDPSTRGHGFYSGCKNDCGSVGLYCNHSWHLSDG